ncbi:MAG: 16S rRNA (guanine(966)-N(2))-methyltransferase RsmD [Candidatus Nitrospinota bacterium M3_3B_026]
MRIIGGVYRGRRLAGPKGDDVRPTPDRVREALFNIIGARIEGAAFLDLFSGTGAAALEAISRGAARAAVVELKHIDLVRENAAKLGVSTPDPLRGIRGDVFDAVETMAERGERFNIIFADPPWKAGLEERVVNEAARLLAPGGTLVLEAFHKTEAPKPAGADIAMTGTRRYGDTALIFYERLP